MPLTMRPLTVLATLLLLVAAAAWMLSGRDPTSPNPTAASLTSSSLAAAGPDSTGQGDASLRTAVAKHRPQDWQDIGRRWLFGPDSTTAGERFQQGVAGGAMNPDDAAALVLNLLLLDLQPIEPTPDSINGLRPRLLLDAPVAAFLRHQEHPGPTIVALAHEYVRCPSPPGCHSVLQGMLAGWPCFDADSCRAALTAALAGLDEVAVWALLRQRLLRQGPSALAEIVAASVELANAEAPRLERLTLIMEAMFSFAETSDVNGAIVYGMRDLGRLHLMTTAEGERSEIEGFGVWSPGMSVWAIALRACLDGQPSNPDAIPVALRLQAIETWFGSTWPGEDAEANAFHRLLLNLADRNGGPGAIAYLRRCAALGSQAGVRITALAKLGATQSVAELERTFAEIVAADATAIHDTTLRVGFYAAVDNARLRDIGSRNDAIRVFGQCLAEQTGGAIEAQYFVLTALARNPLPELAWAVEQLAHHQGSAQLAEQAARTLLILQR